MAKQPEVEREADEAGQQGGKRDSLVAAQESVHRGGQQPQLSNHQDQHEAEDPVEDRQSLRAGLGVAASRS